MKSEHIFYNVTICYIRAIYLAIYFQTSKFTIFVKHIQLPLVHVEAFNIFNYLRTTVFVKTLALGPFDDHVWTELVWILDPHNPSLIKRQNGVSLFGSVCHFHYVNETVEPI